MGGRRGGAIRSRRRARRLLAPRSQNGPQYTAKPMFFSYYWPYTFPTSTVATASIYYAAQEQTRSSECLAMVLVGFSVLVLMLVLGRMCYHAYEVAQGRGNWDDAIVARFLAQQKLKEENLKEHAPEKVTRTLPYPIPPYPRSTRAREGRGAPRVARLVPTSLSRPLPPLRPPSHPLILSPSRAPSRAPSHPPILSPSQGLVADVDVDDGCSIKCCSFK